MLGIDYSNKMPDLVFDYDSEYVVDKTTLPDPQKDPIIPGARVPIRKVGISPVDLPIIVKRRNGDAQVLQAQASLYCSLDDGNAKGLNLSRLYLLMHDTIKDQLTFDGIEIVLLKLATAQGSKNSYCKLRFKYPWTQKSLRSGLDGHIAYNVELEGRYCLDRSTSGYYKWFLTVEYVYSSTCPCSFELAYDATTKRGVAANAHSQRSRLKVAVEFNPLKHMIWIEDVIDLCREHIPTEVQVVVKREDEQAFAELNGANLLFSEDVCRIMYKALGDWERKDMISDFRIIVAHEESLHPWQAIAVTSFNDNFDDGLI